MGFHFLPRGSSQPRDQTHISCIGRRFFTTEQPGNIHIYTYVYIYICVCVCVCVYTYVCIILFDWGNNLFFLLFYWVGWDLKNYWSKAPNSGISSIMPVTGYKTPSRWGWFLRKLIFPFYCVEGNIFILKFASPTANPCIWSYPEEI